jgi:hypothetical protein
VPLKLHTSGIKQTALDAAQKTKRRKKEEKKVSPRVFVPSFPHVPRLASFVLVLFHLCCFLTSSAINQGMLKCSGTPPMRNTLPESPTLLAAAAGTDELNMSAGCMRAHDRVRAEHA